MEKPSVLIIDDEPDNFDVIETLLSGQDYQLHYAASGQEAIETLNTFQPDLILLDVMMPDLDGIEVCRRIIANPQWQTIPIIMVTALAARDDLARCLSAGANDFISKPVNGIELRARVHSMLRISKQYRDNQQLCLQLQDANHALETALTDLKRAQTQLVHQEKLSLIAQMTAGLAHEINNPINFIMGNLEYSHDYMTTLLQTIAILRKHCSENNPDIQAALAEADLDFIQTDFPKILGSMMHGAERIQTLILNLRNFTRLDEASLKSVDIHQGIDNTLLLLKNRLNPQGNYFEIKIIKQYRTLPKVLCYAGALNLVFLNILTNAIDALEGELGKGEQKTGIHHAPQITIETQATSNAVVISIADNGPGMEPAVANKIFEPFFTTKPIGEGVGLNLAVSSQIVIQQHKGELECITFPDKGTKFIIRLPLEPYRDICVKPSTLSSPQEQHLSFITSGK